MDLSIFLQWFSSLPKELATLLLAMVPVTELRASIPVAILIYKLPVWKAVVFSVIGDFIPAILILYLAGPIGIWCSKRSKLCRRFFDWLFVRTRTRFIKRHAQYGALALMIFVGIPLPFTGSWTGALAAWLFAVPKRLAVPYITAGIVIAALIMTALSLGADGVLQMFGFYI